MTLGGTADGFGALGIDIGGTSMKGAIVDIRSGHLRSEVVSARTPTDPSALIDGVAALRMALRWPGPFGCAFPAVVRNSCLFKATNLPTWEGLDVGARFLQRIGVAPVALNDADAAGIAEARFAAACGDELSVLLTFGTGIGSALLTGGRVLANSELGELAINGVTFEAAASARTITERGLHASEWVLAAQPYFTVLEVLINPARWIIAGGLSERFGEFFGSLHTAAPLERARFRGHAGIVGAALASCTSDPS